MCSVEICDRPAYGSSDLCKGHYERVRRSGSLDPERPLRVAKHEGECEVAKCERPIYAHGYCHGHYQRLRAHGDVRAHVPFQEPALGTCEVEGCDRPKRAKGMCSAHYRRVLKHGDPMPGDPIGKHWRPRYQRARRRGGTYVQKDGYVRQYEPGHPNAQATGYVLQHRFVMSEHLGRPLADDEIVHHINGDRTDNRLANLELCVHVQPPGQRVVDLVSWAESILTRYHDEVRALRIKRSAPK